MLEEILILEKLDKLNKTNKILDYYPDKGPLRRDLYSKHTKFFAAGSTFTERLMLAANRVGKTEGVGAFEVTLHLTGIYPKWWKGRRFDKPVDGWAAGDTSETVRDILQSKLLGKLDEIGTGMIPADLIHDYTRRTGRAECVDTIYVKHKSGGISSVGLKSYDQDRKAFQGTKKDFVWLDEEPPLDIYTECLIRTMDTSGGDDNGLMLLTFTPLLGLSETVMAFLPNGQIKDRSEGSKFVVMASWDDAPHLSKQAKELLWSSIPPFQRDARAKGVPQLGAGAIYPVPESDFVVDDFKLRDDMPRLYGMDVGWNRTAVPWGAWDRQSDIIYLYSEYYRGEAEPVIHAEAIKSRGDWIPGVIDPASRGRAQKDGAQLFQMYTDLGLKLQYANNGVETGIYEVWQRLSTGRLKVFRSLSNWLYEFRLYRRDEKGRIVKQNDHLMDATRYLIMGLEYAKAKALPKEEKQKYANSGGGNSWMG
jgi:phage terminase large subunit-like protein